MCVASGVVRCLVVELSEGFEGRPLQYRTGSVENVPKARCYDLGQLWSGKGAGIDSGVDVDMIVIVSEFYR